MTVCQVARSKPLGCRRGSCHNRRRPSRPPKPQLPHAASNLVDWRLDRTGLRALVHAAHPAGGIPDERLESRFAVAFPHDDRAIGRDTAG